MKYLKTYQQINESKGSDFLEGVLDKFSKSIDSKKLSEFITPHKEFLRPYFDKYVKNGIINADLIHSDFSKLNFKANESWGRDDDYAYDTDNNPVLRYLYKFFVRWPKSFVKGIWEFFHMTVIETFKDGGMGVVMSMFMSMMWVLAAILVYLLGMLMYQVTDYAFNGLEKGKVKTEIKFEPAHYEDHVHTIIVGKVTTTYITHDWEPNKWHTQVQDENGKRVENWVTYNKEVGEHTKVGQEVVNDDNWSWEGTE
jgi:hypothetical protein